MRFNPFSKTYEEARQRFRDAASAIGAQLLSYPVDVDASEDISIDVAICGQMDADSAVVVSSGCHGVEGYFGSAIQLAWLKNVASYGTALDRRCVLIHSINPYGFKHLRRVNEDNVDLNRNFLGAPDQYQGSPEGYHRLDRFLNPRSAPSNFEAFRLKALWHICRVGLPALKSAIAGGQYDYPTGLFFGGKGPSRSTRILQNHFESWIGPSRKIVHIDLHSGLGKYGRYQMLLTDPIGSATYHWFSTTFGEKQVQTTEKPGGVAYPVSGILGQWLRARLAPRDVRSAVAEFGTYDAIRVLGAIRAENRAHFYGIAGSNTVQSAKTELLECFCPADERWGKQVIASGLQIIEKCVHES